MPKEYKITVDLRLMFEFGFCLELITADVSNTSYYVGVENGGLLCDVTR